MILCDVPIVGARRPMKRAATEGCMRQWTQARAGLEAAPLSRKKDHVVSQPCDPSPVTTHGHIS
ncbi:hypothetical protein BDA96_02G107300 [Sorghum bicolor]|jgi:hypothetical protein|uniref:Uncharacterized protein n=1 Tax=Sorghum bicolor TaxID=4558 RepID=A0A921RLP7_SORBI|nr:hypothetical protein BDA96_02G107300 [Sorghum bicolor]